MDLRAATIISLPGTMFVDLGGAHDKCVFEVENGP